MSILKKIREFFWGFNNLDLVEDDPKIEELLEKGFHYNKEEDKWERTWLVATKTGAETSKEVWTNDDGGWRVAMYGDNGEVFFEYKVSES
jgi:hypothetical protein